MALRLQVFVSDFGTYVFIVGTVVVSGMGLFSGGTEDSVLASLLRFALIMVVEWLYLGSTQWYVVAVEQVILFAFEQVHLKLINFFILDHNLLFIL